MNLAKPFLSLALLAQGGDSQWVERLAFWIRPELRGIEERIGIIDKTLGDLPELTQINSSASIGFKTAYAPDEEELWVEVDLPEATLADSVVLVPPLAKGASGVVSGYGFPTRFRIDIFNERDEARTVLEATTRDFPNPSGHPVLVTFTPTPVRRVRFTATEPWQRDGPPVLALAEMLVLSGTRNAALGATVTSTSSRDYPTSWSRRNLVDMVTPLGLPVAPAKTGRPGFHSAVAAKADETKSVTITLPAIVPLDEVRLVPVRRREVPLWFDYGFPVRFRVESATAPDFSDRHLIYETTAKTPPVHGMNPVCLAAQRTPARYLRITATQLWQRREDFVFALAEVQAFSDGRNIALGASASASDVLTGDGGAAWSPGGLTDGMTESGRLIDLPVWFAQLEQRRVLEDERAQLTATRSSLIGSAQRTLVSGSVASAAGVTLLAALLLWRQQRNRRRDAARLHEKLARDLHDEIGSNLGSITLICSFSSQPEATIESLRADLAEIENVAAESADSMRDIVQIISPRARDGGKDWLDVLQSLTERLLRGIELDCAIPAAPLATEPDIETRRELYLFCKEVLHNIVRHARATKVRFQIAPTPEGMCIQITDDGIGFDPSQASGGHGLSNLRERAATMNARLHLTSKPGEGTVVHLDLPRANRWLPR